MRLCVTISAATGEGLDRLLTSIEKYIPQKYAHVTLKIPYEKSNLLGQIRTHGKVYSEIYEEDGTQLDVNLEIAFLSKVREYVICLLYTSLLASSTDSRTV